MENWEIEIRRFDQDLFLRMQIIIQHECIRLSEAFERSLYEKGDRFNKGGAAVRWRDRNREWFNQCKRLARLKRIDHYREIEKLRMRRVRALEKACTSK